MSALEEMLRAGVPLWPSWETPTEFTALTRLPFGSVNKAVCGAGLRARRVVSQTAAVGCWMITTQLLSGLPSPIQIPQAIV